MHSDNQLKAVPLKRLALLNTHPLMPTHSNPATPPLLRLYTTLPGVYANMHWA